MKSRRGIDDDAEIEIDALLCEIPHATKGLLTNPDDSICYPRHVSTGYSIFGGAFSDGSSSSSASGGASGSRSPVCSDELAERLRAMHVSLPADSREIWGPLSHVGWEPYVDNAFADGTYAKKNQHLPYGCFDWGSKGLEPAKGFGFGLDDDSYIIQGTGAEYVVRESRAEKARGVRVGVAAGGGYGHVPRRWSPGMGLRGYVYLLAKDQQGCRFLQRKFEERNLEELELIFREIIDHVGELMVSPFANYLMQKLFCVCTDEQRLLVVDVLTSDPRELLRISINQYGTRPVQKLIETLTGSRQVGMVMSALRPWFLMLIKDPNGNHVIQRCLHCLRDEDLKFIFETAIKNCVDIATHQHGCCVLQRCIGRATGLHRSNLVTRIADNGLVLVQDAYGNYVVQYVMDLQIQQDNDKLMAQFVGNFVELSKNKFSSNVVEKCLKMWADYRGVIVNELLSVPNFSELLQHPYANYVIQSALSCSKGQLYHSLLRAIEPYEPSLATSPYCKRIFSRSTFRK